LIEIIYVDFAPPVSVKVKVKLYELMKLSTVAPAAILSTPSLYVINSYALSKETETVTSWSSKSPVSGKV
jgi:hypothetical protein